MAGQALRVGATTVQVVTQSTSVSGAAAGNTAVVQSLSTQVVTQSTSVSGAAAGNTTAVSALFTQIVTGTFALAARVAGITAQVVRQSTSVSGAAAGVTTRASRAVTQVVYTNSVPELIRQRAWTFDFDGHTFYVLDMAESGALVYDTTTGGWSKWTTAGYGGHFNMKNGFHWRDGKQVVGGGLLNGLVVHLDEDTYLDEDFRLVAYEVQGVVFLSTETYVSQYNLRLVGSPGRRGSPDDIDPPVLRMQYSDDNGSTWSNERTIALTSNAEQRIEFRSLGSFKQPGRIFRLYDDGGVKFISYVMADVEGESPT